MPLYRWVDKKSKKEVEVLRTFDTYQDPPTKEEAPDIEEPEWERMIGGKQMIVKGRGWGPGKGYW